MSHTATIWASLCLWTSFMSWMREMRPKPIAPITTRFDGAFWPNTLAGTIAGAASAAPVLRMPRLDKCMLPSPLRPAWAAWRSSAR
jgi:hypothetical protein